MLSALLTVLSPPLLDADQLWLVEQELTALPDVSASNASTVTIARGTWMSHQLRTPVRGCTP